MSEADNVLDDDEIEDDLEDEFDDNDTEDDDVQDDDGQDDDDGANRIPAATARAVLDYLVRALVDDPDAVEIDAAEGRRGISLRVTGSSFFASSPIFASIAARSSGVNGRLYEKS